MNARIVSALAALLLVMAAPQALAEDPWADSVVDYSPVAVPSGYDDAEKALGAPVGAGPTYPSNSSIVSLGAQGGAIILAFNSPVTDDPSNPMGLDCIVYSNCFWVAGNPQYKFQEPGLIEISEDANSNGQPDDPWYLIPGSRGFAYDPFPWRSEPDGLDNIAPNPSDCLAGNIRNPNGNNVEYNWGYCEMTPTRELYLDNYVRPDDPTEVGFTPRSGGGDAFDIAWAVDSSGNLSRHHPIPFHPHHLFHRPAHGFLRLCLPRDRGRGRCGPQHRYRR